MHILINCSVNPATAVLMASASDPSKLWWPPFQRLSDALESLRADHASISAENLQKQLQPYSAWLAAGIDGFRPPNAGSKQALETQSSLAVGSSKLPIEAPLASLALQLSAALVCRYQSPHTTAAHSPQNLDELQSYVLLRRWWTAQPNRKALTAAPPDALSPAQLEALAVMLCRERTLLLNALESLLRLAHGVPWCHLMILEGVIYIYPRSAIG